MKYISRKISRRQLRDHFGRYGLCIENPDGGGIEKDGVAYIGLSSVWDISEAPEINEFYAGDTFTEGKAIFAMVKDVSGYVVESSYPDENDEMVYSYVEGK